MTRYLVIGAGFVGRSIQDTLHRNGAEATLLSSRSLTCRQQSIQNDWAKDRVVVLAMGRATPSASPVVARRLAEEYSTQLGTLATLLNLESAERLLLISSAGPVYGRNAQGIADETTPVKPDTPYGKLKVEEEESVHRSFPSVPITILRCTNLYGPSQELGRTQGIVPIAIRRIAANQPLTVYGDGSQLRDYLYASDLGSLILALQSSEPQSLVNVASKHRVSVLSLIAEIELVVGRRASLTFAPAEGTLELNQPPVGNRLAHSLVELAGITGWPTPLQRGLQLTAKGLLE